ncbi:MAG: NUDIX domain-containing protein, partial [Planctomycetia bacterium]|nr:NUDIX domain-containing protein [Planctomycetia bacterium]
MNFVDTESGEVCWVAWACRAPNCPGRGPDGEPFLCIEADMGYFAKPDGTVGYDPKLSAMTPKRVGMCPQCSVIRKPESETPEQAAARETLEETGWRPGPLTFLGHYKPLAISNHGFNLYVADGATHERDFDRNEIGDVRWFPADEVRR